MKNTDLLSKKLEDALTYLYNQEQKLKPTMEFLQDLINKKIREQELSAKDAFEMLVTIQAQYTNNILLITKIKELIDFSD